MTTESDPSIAYRKLKIANRTIEDWCEIAVRKHLVFSSEDFQEIIGEIVALHEKLYKLESAAIAEPAKIVAWHCVKEASSNSKRAEKFLTDGGDVIRLIFQDNPGLWCVKELVYAELIGANNDSGSG